jgi:hypothetical protein
VAQADEVGISFFVIAGGTPAETDQRRGRGVQERLNEKLMGLKYSA